MADNMPGPLNVRLTLDGTVVLNEPRSQGNVRWTPPANLTAANHTVTALVTDAVGSSGSTTWTFRVQAGAAMSDANDCANCHPSYVLGSHPYTDCYGCHSEGTDVDGNHISWAIRPRRGRASAVMVGPRERLSFTAGQCADCHSTTWPASHGMTRPSTGPPTRPRLPGAPTATTHRSSTSTLSTRRRGRSRTSARRATRAHRPPCNRRSPPGTRPCDACHASVSHYDMHNRR